MPPLFVALIIVAYIFQSKCPFVYGYSQIETPVQNDQQLADELITESFGDTNMVALVIPAGDYEKERKLINDLEARSRLITVRDLPTQRQWMVIC